MKKEKQVSHFQKLKQKALHPVSLLFPFPFPSIDKKTQALRGLKFHHVHIIVTAFWLRTIPSRWRAEVPQWLKALVNLKV